MASYFGRRDFGDPRNNYGRPVAPLDVPANFPGQSSWPAYRRGQTHLAPGISPRDSSIAWQSSASSRSTSSGVPRLSTTSDPSRDSATASMTTPRPESARSVQFDPAVATTGARSSQPAPPSSRPSAVPPLQPPVASSTPRHESARSVQFDPSLSTPPSTPGGHPSARSSARSSSRSGYSSVSSRCSSGSSRAPSRRSKLHDNPAVAELMRIGYPQVAAERAHARTLGLPLSKRPPPVSNLSGKPHNATIPLAERDTDDESLTPAERIAIYKARALGYET